MKQNTCKVNREVDQTEPQKLYVGIDISKDYLDVNVCHKHHRFANDASGQHCMFRLFEKQACPVHVVYESTGWLSRRLIAVFMENKIAQTCLNPSRVRAYARSEGFQAKTDRLDAEILTRMGEEKKLQEDFPLTDEILKLKEYRSVLVFYVKRRTQLKNQLAAVSDPRLKRQLTQALKQEEKRIEQLETSMEEVILSHRELQAKYEAYLQVAGIGKRNAMALICEMPELGKINRRAASALLGVVPYAWESGSMKGKRSIRGGRKGMRQLLYMATVSSLRCNKVLRLRYEHLLGRGKAKKCALIACCHTLIIHLNSLTRKVILPGSASHAAEGDGGRVAPQRKN